MWIKFSLYNANHFAIIEFNTSLKQGWKTDEKQKNVLIISIAIIAVIVGITLYFERDNSQYMPYPDFYNYVKSGKVVSAKIGNDEVRFYLNGDQTEYRTTIRNWIPSKNFYSLTELKLLRKKVPMNFSSRLLMQFSALFFSDYNIRLV